jgi:hypothetical protein
MECTFPSCVYLEVFGVIAAGVLVFFVYVGYQEISVGNTAGGSRALILPAAVVIVLFINFVKRIERS